MLTNIRSVDIIIIILHYVHVFVIYNYTCLYCVLLSSIELPLSGDIEGPAKQSSYVLTLGSRYTSLGEHDKAFSGSLAAAILLPSSAPPGFASCVLDCLESMTVNTTGTNIVSLGFDESTRMLSLVGEAKDFDYEKVLQSLIYLNKASDKSIANIDDLTLTVSDGVGTTKVTLQVNVFGSRKRRNEAAYLIRRRFSKLN